MKLIQEKRYHLQRYYTIFIIYKVWRDNEKENVHFFQKNYPQIFETIKSHFRKIYSFLPSFLRA